MSGSIATQLQDSLRQLHLPTFRENCHAQGVLSDREGASYAQCLLTLCEMELTDRRERRIQRLRNASKLPLAKTLSAFDRGFACRKVWIVSWPRCWKETFWMAAKISSGLVTCPHERIHLLS